MHFAGTSRLAASQQHTQDWKSLQKNGLLMPTQKQPHTTIRLCRKPNPGLCLERKCVLRAHQRRRNGGALRTQPRRLLLLVHRLSMPRCHRRRRQPVGLDRHRLGRRLALLQVRHRVGLVHQAPVMAAAAEARLRLEAWCQRPRLQVVHQAVALVADAVEAGGCRRVQCRHPNNAPRKIGWVVRVCCGLV